MLKKYATLSLIVLMLNLFFVTVASAGTNEEKNAARAEKIKAAITKLGTGPEAKIEVKLYDNSKIKGYVKEAAEDHVVIADAKTGVDVEVPYPQAKQVKGNNLNLGVKIAIGFAIAFGLVLLFVALNGRD